MGAFSSMNIFLRQEVDRMQKVITLVRTTLQDLQLAIEGTIIMSEVGLATIFVGGGINKQTLGTFCPL